MRRIIRNRGRSGESDVVTSEAKDGLKINKDDLK